MSDVPADYRDMVAPMRAAHQLILSDLAAYDLLPPPSPPLPAPRPRGTAAARAYPMQGVLKYHGMSDWDQRIAFLPSISVNNGAAQTVTVVAFDPSLTADVVEIGGLPAHGREFERVVTVLDTVRALAGVTTRAAVQSRNLLQTRVAGKGLGTSASAAAALAAAALAALFGPAVAADTRRTSTLARRLAGSGCRSVAGGLALWLSYPGIDPAESFALRLDRADALADMALITLPIDSSIGLKTESAHLDAPQSSLFRGWMLSRAAEIRELIAAAQRGDWRAVGQWSELDSMRLHGVTMSGSREQKLIGWEPLNLTLFRLCNDLRARGVPVYASTDTGPTVVFITGRSYVADVQSAIAALDPALETVVSPLAGPAEIIDVDQARRLIAAP
jgi:diphosphomevalonate decarboxylase